MRGGGGGRFSGFVVAILTVSLPGGARADEPPLPNPIEALGDDTVRAFTGGKELVLYGAAVASLVALSPTGGDNAVRVAVQEHVHAPAWGDAAYYTGYVLPVLLPTALYLTGVATRERSVAGAGSAAITALGLTVITTVVLKVGTGRPFPRHGLADDAPDRLQHPEYAKEFEPFGFGGRYAWPSGHTSATIALAAALTSYARGVWWVPVVTYSIALGVGAGMIVGDHHWTSDVLSGGAIGQAIGWSVGSSFRERGESHGLSATRHRGDAACSTFSWTLVPLSGDARGIAIMGTM
jgi:membrane-associated phospholipid phosphatase